MSALRLLPRILLVLLSGAFAHALMLAAGVWSAGLFLAPAGLIAGLATGPAQAWLRAGFGQPTRGWWRRGALGWLAFGLVGSGLAWLSLQVAFPDASVGGVLAFAAPSIVGGAIAAGVVQTLFGGTPGNASLTGWLIASFAVSGFILVLGLRLQHPWLGVAVATPVWTALVSRALKL